MANRTFKQLGHAYGSTPVTIVVHVDGTEVYSGAVPTSDQPVPTLPNLDVSLTSQLFTWEKAISDSGTSTLAISVTGGTLLMSDTLANYAKRWICLPPKTIMSSGADGWTLITDHLIGPSRVTAEGAVVADPENQNFRFAPGSADPLSNVTINGVAKTADRTDDLHGQYYWTLQSGDEFVCTVTYVAGLE